MRLILLLGSIVCTLVGNSESQSFCEFDLDDIKSCISMGKLEVTHFVLNCLAAHNSSFAESISLSAFTGENDGVRYDFQCYEGTTFIRTTSTNISSVAHHACGSCHFNLSDPCENASCSDRCGSCPRGEPDNCTSCRYLVNRTSNHSDCLKSTSCAMYEFKVGEDGCECPEGHYLQPIESEAQCEQPDQGPRYLLPNKETVYRCVNQCNHNSTRVDGDDVCYACGIERCTECANRSGDNTIQCNCCVKGYSNYTNNDNSTNNESVSQCIPLIEKKTKLLEEMKKEEKEEKEDADLLLKILLPLFCALTIVVFVGLSVFAHYYFPYIDSKGDKRHRKRPQFAQNLNQPLLRSRLKPRPTVNLP